MEPKRSQSKGNGMSEAVQEDLLHNPCNSDNDGHPPKVSIDEAALCFWRWAFQEGLTDYCTDMTPCNTSSISNISNAGRGVLRSKGVVQIGTNSTSGIISVFLRRAAPTPKQLRVLPNAVSGYPIQYIQGVPFDVSPVVAFSQSSPSCQMRVSGGIGRYTCGSSVSPANNRDAGTMGALVKDASGVVFGLTNNHVSGACNHSAIGLPILAPGVTDVVANGLDPFTIGHHARSLAITPGDVTVIDPKENLDAAIFRIRDASMVTSYQGGSYDTPETAVNLVAGMAVEKVGRTTGHTTGVVTAKICGPFPIKYAAQIYGFAGSVYYDPLFTIVGQGDLFSTYGDSGSLIVTTLPDGKKAAVGLVVGGLANAGVPGGAISLALPITPILTRLGVTLVSQHHV